MDATFTTPVTSVHGGWDARLDWDPPCQQDSQSAGAVPAEVGPPQQCPYKASLQLFLFILIVVPTVLFITSAGLGGVLAWLEDWPYMDGFYYIAGILVNANSAFTSRVPTNTFGRIAVIVVAAWGISVAVVVLSMIGGQAFLPIGRRMRVHAESMRLGEAIRKFVILAVVVIPVTLLLVSAILAGPLAGIEVRRAVLCHVVSCSVVSCHVVSCRVGSGRVVSCRVVSCRVPLCQCGVVL